MSPLMIGLAAIGGYLFLSKSGLAGVAGPPVPKPVIGARPPPQPGVNAQGAVAGQQGGSGTAQIIAAGGGAVKDVAGAFVSLWDALSTSQDSPPDPAPSANTVKAPSLSGGGMAGSDWYGYFAGGVSGPDVAAGDGTFVMGNPPA